MKNTYPKYNQILTINSEGNNEYIRTGATFNNINYISMPVILAMYDTSDPTLRKYLKLNGKKEDSFLADGRLFINESFLKSNSFYLKTNNKSTFHPYQKRRITGAKLPYLISTKHLSKDEKEQILNKNKKVVSMDQLLVKELKKVNWDYFITIHTASNTTQDYWDLTMLKFIDKLSFQLENQNIKAAYCTEYTLDPNEKRSKLLIKGHRHIHILLDRDKSTIKLDTIKSILLESMNRKRFSKKEYHLSMYDKSLWATNYILKQYYLNNSCFSISVPKLEIK